MQRLPNELRWQHVSGSDGNYYAPEKVYVEMRDVLCPPISGYRLLAFLVVPRSGVSVRPGHLQYKMGKVPQIRKTSQ